MAINFTQNAKLVIDKAKELASETGGIIGTEHILYGLVSIESSECSELLARYGITAARIMQYLEKTEIFYSVEISQKAKRTLENADNLASSYNEEYVSPEFILVALLGILDGLAFQIIVSLSTSVTELMEKAKELIENDGCYFEEKYDEPEGYKMESIAKAFKDLFGSGGQINAGIKSETRKNREETTFPDELGVELVARAASGKLDGAVGREKEIDRIIQILCRRTKNNPVLIGEAGVGKTAVVEELANLIASKKAPDAIKNKKIFSLSIGGLLSGTKYRGEFEEKLIKLLKTLSSDGNTILFIDEIHSIVGAGKAEGAIDLANLLKPLLARGELQTIGATTIDEYRKYIEKDSALERRFQPVLVSPPTVGETITILLGIKEKFEKHHKVSITEDAVRAAAEMSDRYIQDRFLPDKAIDLMDEAASKTRLKKTAEIGEEKVDEQIDGLNAQIKLAIDAEEYTRASELKKERTKLNLKKAEILSDSMRREIKVTREDIAAVAAEMTGIPLERITEDEGAKIIQMELKINKKIIGQKAATSSVCSAIRRSRSGLKDKKRPIGVFLFVGETGVGKTEMAKCIAENIFGSSSQLIKLDMGEYTEKTAVNKLVGADPGYIGYDDGGQLTERVRRKPYSVVLFDEIEKAHRDVYNLLLSVLEDGELTDSHGRKVSFRNTVIIMTGNLSKGTSIRGKVGFLSHSAGEDKDSIRAELEKFMSPEFIARIDEIIQFNPLTQENLTEIAKDMLAEVAKKVHEQNIDVIFHDDIAAYIAIKCGEGNGGAREARRLITSQIVNLLSEYFVSGKSNVDDKLEIITKDGKFEIEKR